MLVGQRYDAHLPLHRRLDDGVHRGARSAPIGPVCPGRPGGSGHGNRPAPSLGQGDVGPGQRILTGPEDRVHEPERLELLVARQCSGQMTPEHVLQDHEGGLDVGQVDAGPEAVHRELLGRRDDRIGAALVQALPDQLQKVLNVATALRRAGHATAGLIALFEGGYRVADHPVPGPDQDC